LVKLCKQFFLRFCQTFGVTRPFRKIAAEFFAPFFEVGKLFAVFIQLVKGSLL
jgi:hypothetical protein